MNPMSTPEVSVSIGMAAGSNVITPCGETTGSGMDSIEVTSPTSAETPNWPICSRSVANWIASLFVSRWPAAVMFAPQIPASTREASTEVIVKDGETGLLVPIRDHEQLAGAIVRLLTDRDLRDRLARAAAARVRAAFSVDRMVDETLALYETLAGTRRAAGSVDPGSGA